MTILSGFWKMAFGPTSIVKVQVPYDLDQNTVPSKPHIDLFFFQRKKRKKPNGENLRECKQKKEQRKNRRPKEWHNKIMQ